jgi:plastocyanin
MRSVAPFLLIAVVVGSLLSGGLSTTMGTAFAQSAQVVIVDNDGPGPSDGIDPRTGEWGYAPYHLAVTSGEQVTFTNPAGNFRPHNVVSFSRGGTSQEPIWEVGAKFSSGTASAELLRPEGATLPGSSEPARNTWSLDTSTLAPGHYTYICTLHPWMTGTITILGQ